MPTEFDVTTLDFETKSADQLFDTAINMWSNDFRVACGFTLEDLVILHKLAERGAKPGIFFIDTGRHFEHTYAAADAAKRYFGFRIEWYWPDPRRLQELVQRDGAVAIIKDVEARRRCCAVRRLEPLARALEGAVGWMNGARRAQCGPRAKLPKLVVDKGHDWMPRMAPLADWSYGQVVEYVNQNRLPASNLFRKAYASVGCAPCTRAIQTGEPERAGRWSFEDPEQRERGEHISGQW